VVIEKKTLWHAGPVSRIRRAALQTDNLFEISSCGASMMSTLPVMAGFASHRRHNCGFIGNRGRGWFPDCPRERGRSRGGRCRVGEVGSSGASIRLGKAVQAFIEPG
jgi:hypothetical protein